LYTSKEDIDEISSLMRDIKDGKISRNKNYYTLAKSKEFNRYKRAKLLISLTEDLGRTAEITGNKIKIRKENGTVEISLFNPIMKYNRKVVVTEAELRLLLDWTDVTFEEEE